MGNTVRHPHIWKKNVSPNTLITWKLENALNIFILVWLECIIRVSKEYGFDLQIENVHYLVEFRLYDLRQTMQIFTTVAFRLCKFSLQLHLGVFQSFYFDYKEMRVLAVCFFKCEDIALYFPKLRVKFIIKIKVRVHECNFPFQILVLG